MNLNQTLQAVMTSLKSGDLRSAETLLDPLRKSYRNNPNVLYLAACLDYKKLNYEQAIRSLRKALQAEPLHHEARLLLGIVLMDVNRAEEAIVQLSRLIHSEPANAAAHFHLGGACWQLGRVAEAKAAYLKSASLEPKNFRVFHMLGVLCKENGDLDAAYGFLRQALSLATSGDFFQVWKSMEDLPQVYEHTLEMVRRETPGISLPMAYQILQESCRWDVVGSIQDKVLDLAVGGTMQIEILQRILLISNCRADIGADRLFMLHRAWGELAARQAGRGIRQDYAMPKDGKLRIGYLSGDFSEHSVGMFIRNVITNHSPDRFEIHCYSTLDTDDPVAREIRQAAHAFSSVASMSDEERAKKIYQDGIHILVDLSGHTGASGLAALAYHPAPVQMTYLGYPNTSGLKAVDFRITDQYAESPGGTRYTEELLVMPESFLCFGKFDERPVVELAACNNKGYVTFASFNHVRKLTPDLVRIWSAILQRVDDSSLMLKSIMLAREHVRANIIAEFAKWGIAAERLKFAEYISSRASHLDLYNEVDIALDTFPYNGTTTTCEALWMQVPVVTLVGTLHAQRVSFSLLKNIGIEELIAHNEQEYIDIAVALATDRDRLNQLRARLRGALRGSILCDPARFTGQLEELYCDAWRRKGYVLPFKVESLKGQEPKPSQ